MVKCPISKWLHQGGYELDEGEDSTRYGFEVMLVGGMPVAVHRKGAKVYVSCYCIRMAIIVLRMHRR